jgi:hypothetical protein
MWLQFTVQVPSQVARGPWCIAIAISACGLNLNLTLITSNLPATPHRQSIIICETLPTNTSAIKEQDCTHGLPIEQQQKWASINNEQCF